jgi:hypothetical protein
MRLLAPDRVPTEVEYSRYTKQADANDYQQKQMQIDVNVKEHMAVSDIMLGITRDYWDHYVSFPGPCYHWVPDDARPVV